MTVVAGAVGQTADTLLILQNHRSLLGLVWAYLRLRLGRGREVAPGVTAGNSGTEDMFREAAVEARLGRAFKADGKAN